MANTGETAATIAKEQEPESYQSEITQQSDAATAPEVPQASETASSISQPKINVSDQDYTELLPKLMTYFGGSREKLARALGIHRSTVDRWVNGTSRPNNSTLLRMRRLAQERDIG